MLYKLIIIKKYCFLYPQVVFCWLLQETKINGAGTRRRAISLSRESPSCKRLPEQGVLPAQSSWDPGPCSQHQLPSGGCSHVCWGRRLWSLLNSTPQKGKENTDEKNLIFKDICERFPTSLLTSLWQECSRSHGSLGCKRRLHLVSDWAAMRPLKWEGCTYDRNSEKGHWVTVNCLCIHPHSGLVKMAFHYEIYLGWIVFQNVQIVLLKTMRYPHKLDWSIKHQVSFEYMETSQLSCIVFNECKYM